MNNTTKKLVKKKGQQEMVGFVLIIVLVVVGMMVFLVLSLRETTSEEPSVDVKNMLDAILDYTTDCAIVFEPQYDTIEDLFKSAYQEETCTNKGVSASIYLEDILTRILEDLGKGEASTAGFELDFVSKDDIGEEGILQVRTGDCSQSTVTQSAQRNLISQGTDLLVRLRACKIQT